MFTNKNISLLILLFFVSVSFYQHSNLLNKEIVGRHDWRQSQTMWNIRNFVRHDNCILNSRDNSFNGNRDNILRYEFPLMQWTIAQIQKLLGEQIATVRVSVFLIGISTLIFFTLLIHHLFEDWYVAIFSSILLQYSPVFYYYTINPIPDNMAFSFGMAYIYYIV